MKKCISILLIMSLFINSGGFIIIFLQVQSSVKSKVMAEIRAGIYDAGHLVKFRVKKGTMLQNANGIIWKNAHEFECKGMLYDIIRIFEERDEAILYCINDLNEEKIVKTFNNELSNLSAGKLGHSKYKTSLLNLISIAVCTNAFRIISASGQQQHHPDVVYHISTIIMDIPLPPPKSA